MSVKWSYWLFGYVVGAMLTNLVYALVLYA
jgi:hypothetical protein